MGQWDVVGEDATVLRSKVEQETHIMPNGKANPGWIPAQDGG